MKQKITENTEIPLPSNLKFDEDRYLSEIRNYIAETYKQHYAVGNTQAFELIADAGQGEGFCLGNIVKLASRYGKKDGFNKKDLLKIAHYSVLLLYLHSREHRNGV